MELHRIKVSQNKILQIVDLEQNKFNYNIKQSKVT